MHHLVVTKRPTERKLQCNDSTRRVTSLLVVPQFQMLCCFIPFVDFVDPFVIILIKRVYKLIVFIGVVIYRSVKRDIILTKTPKSKIPKPLRYSQ